LFILTEVKEYSSTDLATIERLWSKVLCKFDTRSKEKYRQSLRETLELFGKNWLPKQDGEYERSSVGLQAA
jgi:hypothetical protein